MENKLMFSQEKDEALFTRIDEDLDYAFALSLQEDILNTKENFIYQTASNDCTAKSTPSLSGIVDEQWELIDPNPDIHALFLQYNAQFFYGKLEGVEVRWSPRMTLCAGVCCYEGRGGLCSVRLSLPLLKLRPRKDLVETLLHEMIHAYLFITANNKDRDGHGPEFLKHMYRINKEAGTKISVYHSFHDEVDLYRKHWWKCNGPCQKRGPFFGLVKRAMNRAPGPHDTWWSQHRASCGGEFIKIKEPENLKKNSLKRKHFKKENHSQDIRNFLGSPAAADSSNVNVSKKLKESTNTDFLKSVLGEAENCHLINGGITKSYFHKDVHTVPFSGQGFQLGSSSSTHPRSFLATIRQELASSISNNPVLNSPHKHYQPGHLPNSLNLKVSKKELTKTNDAFVNTAHSVKVECPVCHQTFTDINTHLDTCLSITK